MPEAGQNFDNREMPWLQRATNIRRGQLELRGRVNDVDDKNSTPTKYLGRAVLPARRFITETKVVEVIGGAAGARVLISRVEHGESGR